MNIPLTVSMATHDDYDGVYFTVQSLRLHHHLPVGTEILVLDNNPDSEHGRALAGLAKSIKDLRVVPVRDRMSSFIKYDAFQEARGDVILGLDCHVLLQGGFIERLMAYWAANPGSADMLTGPLLYNDLRATSVKMNPTWRGHDFGTWGDDPAGVLSGVPFEVPMQGMGCFSFLRQHVPTINPGFRGFGAEEWYVAEKVRQNGGRVMCDPALGWNHRFDWPRRRFPLTLDDKVRNYYRGWLELYGSLDHPMVWAMSQHWLGMMSQEKLDALIAESQRFQPAPA